MGFWDGKLNGPFDDMFDLDGDGRLSPGEEAFKYDFFNSFDNDSNDSDDDFDNDLENDLTLSGLDSLDLSLMDDDERREALEEAGLDPDDYDDFDF